MTLPDWLREIDEQVFLYVNGGLHGLHWKRLEGFLAFFNQMGSGLCAIPILAVVTLLAPTLRACLRRFAELGLPLLGVLLAVKGLKAWADRARPPRALADAFAEGRAFLAFGEHESRGSLPSGHATTAFAVATVIAWWAGGLAPGWRRVVGRTLPFGFASTTCVARIYAGTHFPLDVAAGAILGIALALGGLLLVRGVSRGAPSGSPSGGHAGARSRG